MPFIACLISKFLDLDIQFMDESKATFNFGTKVTLSQGQTVPATVLQ